MSMDEKLKDQTKKGLRISANWQGPLCPMGELSMCANVTNAEERGVGNGISNERTKGKDYGAGNEDHELAAAAAAAAATALG